MHLTINTAILVLLLTCGIFCTTHEKTISCERFKLGKFRLDSRIDSIYWIIDRTDSFQIETNSKTGVDIKMKIKWTGPCEYELIRVTQTEKREDSLVTIIRNLPLKTKIIKTGKGYYVFESYKEGVPMRYSDTLKIITQD